MTTEATLTRGQRLAKHHAVEQSSATSSHVWILTRPGVEDFDLAAAGRSLWKCSGGIKRRAVTTFRPASTPALLFDDSRHDLKISPLNHRVIDRDINELTPKIEVTRW